MDSRITARLGAVLILVLVCGTLGCPPGNGNGNTNDDDDTVAVPDVTGMTQAEAQAALLQAGLMVGTVTEQASIEPAGEVIAQNPPAGTSVAPASPVALTVSAWIELTEYNIREDTTLTAGTYLAESNLTVSEGTLTLAPGVTIVFSQGRSMSVTANGRLHAVGTEALPITLTGAEALRGFWGGLRFYQSNSLDNDLEHVLIEYGGGYYEANVYVCGSSGAPARVRLVACTLRQSSTYGLSMNSYALLSECAENTFTLNTAGAAKVVAACAGYLDDTSGYTGNDEDIVEIAGGTVEEAVAWPGIDAPYRATGNLTVSADLTLDPGVWIEFADGEHMTVDGNGSLSAAGTADHPIVLTGEEQVRGHWGGLRLYNTNSANNRLDHVFIEYGGGYWNANLHLSGSSGNEVRVAITNCTLQQAEDYGLYANSYTNITQFSGNTLTGNALGAADMSPVCAGFLDDTSTYQGNDYDVVELWGGPLETDATWAGIDVPYLLTGSPTVAAALTVSPGAVLMFADGEKLTLNSAGSLSAVGTPANGILFTGEDTVPGYWGGIRLYQTNAPENRFEYCTIEYGGGYYDANLYLAGSSGNETRATVTDCHISDSAEWGIIVNEYSQANPDIATANTFANNASGDVDIR